MGFVGLHFHNASASMAVRHMSIEKSFFFSFFLFQKCNKFVCISSIYIDTLSILTRARKDANFVFIVTVANFLLIWNLSKSCTLSRDWGQSSNRYHKTKVGAYNDKVPWGCRRFRSWKGSATRIPCRADPGLWQVLPVGIELSILRPGLVNQSQEYWSRASYILSQLGNHEWCIRRLILHSRWSEYYQVWLAGTFHQ